MFWVLFPVTIKYKQCHYLQVQEPLSLSVVVTASAHIGLCPAQKDGRRLRPKQEQVLSLIITGFCCLGRRQQTEKARKGAWKPKVLVYREETLRVQAENLPFLHKILEW